MRLGPSIFPKHLSLNPKPETLNLKAEILDPKSLINWSFANIPSSRLTIGVPAFLIFSCNMDPTKKRKQGITAVPSYLLPKHTSAHVTIALIKGVAIVFCCRARKIPENQICFLISSDTPPSPPKKTINRLYIYIHIYIYTYVYIQVPSAIIKGWQ